MTGKRSSPGLGQPFRLPSCDRYEFTSSRTGRVYHLFIAEPSLPPPKAGYPTIYVLDGNATFATIAEAVRLQTRPPHGLDPAIVVGIGYEGDQPFVTDARYRDFTTPAAAANLPKRPNAEAWPANGGADAFASIIEEEIKPFIADRFRVDPDRETLFGHSLGGFFTLHCLFSRPQSFSAFFAGSPSLWWNGRELFSRLAAFEQMLSTSLTAPRLAVGFGADELSDMLEDGRAMAERLRAIPDFGFRYLEVDGEEHISVLPALLSRLVSFALAPEGRPARTTGLIVPTSAARP